MYSHIQLTFWVHFLILKKLYLVWKTYHVEKYTHKVNNAYLTLIDLIDFLLSAIYRYAYFHSIFLNILEIVARFARGKALMNNLFNDFCLLWFF